VDRGVSSKVKGTIAIRVLDVKKLKLPKCI
jgi:hypothetical protein